MVIKGISERYEFGWDSKSLWPEDKERLPVVSSKPVRSVEDKNRDVITLHEKEGVWSSKKLNDKEIRFKKTSSLQRLPFGYNKSGKTYSHISSKGKTINFFA